MYNMPITIVINNEEYNIVVDVNFYRGEPDTYWEPGYPDEVEIIDIVGDDFPDGLQEFSDNQVWMAIAEFEEECYDEILELVYKELGTEQQDAAEYLSDQCADIVFWDIY